MLINKLIVANIDGNPTNKEAVLVTTSNGFLVILQEDSGGLKKVWDRTGNIPAALGSSLTWRLSSEDGLYAIDIDKHSRASGLFQPPQQQADVELIITNAERMGLLRKSGEGLVTLWLNGPHLQAAPLQWRISSDNRFYPINLPMGGIRRTSTPGRPIEAEVASVKAALMIAGTHDGAEQAVAIMCKAGEGLELVWQARQQIERKPGVEGEPWTLRSADRYYMLSTGKDQAEKVMVVNSDTLAVGLFDWTSVGDHQDLTLDWYSSEQIPAGSDELSAWNLQSDDQIHIGDFNADGKDEILIVNLRMNKLAVLSLHAGPVGLVVTHYHEGPIQGIEQVSGWRLQESQRFFIADVNGDGSQEIIVVGSHGSAVAGMPVPQHLAVLKLNDDGLVVLSHDENTVPGANEWMLHHEDQFYPAHINGGKQSELVVTYTPPSSISDTFDPRPHPPHEAPELGPDPDLGPGPEPGPLFRLFSLCCPRRRPGPGDNSRTDEPTDLTVPPPPTEPDQEIGILVWDAAVKGFRVQWQAKLAEALQDTAQPGATSSRRVASV